MLYTASAHLSVNSVRDVIYGNVDKDMFKSNLAQYDVFVGDDVYVMADSVTNVLYTSVTGSEVRACAGVGGEGDLIYVDGSGYYRKEMTPGYGGHLTGRVM